MVGASRPRSAIVQRTGGRHEAPPSSSKVAASLRASKSQGVLMQCHTARSPGITNLGAAAGEPTRVGRKGRNKVLNWYRLPAAGCRAPCARAGHTAVIIGTEMIVFGGIVNGERVDELASFDLHTRVWRLLVPPTPPTDKRREPAPAPAAAAATAPAPRAFHVSWAFDHNVYVHGGEGPVGGARATLGGSEVDDILGCVGRDPFAEEDGGPPLESGRVATAASAGSGATTPGCRSRKNGAAVEGARAGPREHNKRNASQSRVVAAIARGRPAVSVLEDLWKLDTRTLLWERLSSRLAPLGRKGHSASVVPLGGQPSRVLIFGGAPAGRRGLSNALYSVDLAQLCAGQGTWERHRPTGTAPAPRQGHSLTAVAGGKRLVLFGGVAENGELLGDIQILETEGGPLSWAAVQAPVGDVPSARHRHSACEVPAVAALAGGVTRGGGGGVLVFGGEGRVSEGPDIRSTDSHEAFLYDPKESRWWAVETGHAFPASRHGHSMPTIAGWTPPSFHPDGTLTAAELVPQPKTTIARDVSSKTANNSSRAAAAAAVAAAAAAADEKLPSDAARFQWGERPPTCAVVFGGLNSMYVNPEVWLLPLSWRENTVQFSPPSPEPELPQEEENDNQGHREIMGGAGLGGLGFASTVRIKRAAGLAAATARGNVAAAAAGRGLSGSGTEVGTWRLFQAGRVGEGAGAVRHRRASLPGGLPTGAAAFGLEILRSQEQQRQEAGGDTVGGAGGGAERAGRRRDDDDGVGMQDSAAEIEAELIRLKRLVFISGEKLSAEVSNRLRLEETNEEMRREVKELRFSKEASELQLREEIKCRWHEGQKAKARCASLERLLAEAYDLINMVELQHHLQVKSLMPEVYGDPRRRAAVRRERQHGEKENGLHAQGQKQQQHLRGRCVESGSAEDDHGNLPMLAATAAEEVAQRIQEAGSSEENTAAGRSKAKALAAARDPLVAV